MKIFMDFMLKNLMVTLILINKRVLLKWKIKKRTFIHTEL